jgi:hypothetical protein
MRLHEFWLVTKPTANSTLDDILCRTTPRGFALQVRGGLMPNEVHSIWTDYSQAVWCAESLLSLKQIELRTCKECAV